VTAGSATSGAAITLRILAIGLPGVVLVATTDPTDLADALAQLLLLPSRFVLSALAALRLFGVLAEEWRMLGLARRARGLGDAGGLGRLRLLGGQVFALLVLAIRRGTVLATAMEARGFGAGRRRTWARPSRFGPGDAALVLGGIALAAAATAAGLLAGTWQLLLS
jgi:energy-coupling factor transport system permease protein